jgi:hypothetical protein
MQAGIQPELAVPAGIPFQLAMQADIVGAQEYEYDMSISHNDYGAN